MSQIEIFALGFLVGIFFFMFCDGIFWKYKMCKLMKEDNKK